MTLGWSLLFSFFALSTGAQAPAVPPPRDASTTPAPTGVVRGRVTSAATGQPLHRVRLTLNGPTTNPPITVTDTHGRFELMNVPEGTYSITALRAGYLTIQYGQRRPREAGRTLAVKGGETIEGVDISLPKGGTLAGRITDELGDPAPGVRVEAVELRYIRGRRVHVPARIATTNDAGEYRLSGLEPGAYQIRASAAEVWEADDGKSTLTYAATYYPGVTAADQPQSINVSVGQEVPALDFRLIMGRAARISGVVEDTRGEPLAAQLVHLSNVGRTIGGALLFTQGAGETKTDAGGAFEFQKLAPGEYVVHSGGQTDRTSVPVTVSEGEAQHVVLTPRRDSSISGSLVTDEGMPPPFPTARVRVSPIPANPGAVLPLWTQPRDQALKPDWTFRIPGVHGPYLFRVTGLPPDWMLKAVLLGGREITDVALTVSKGDPDMDGLQIVLSRKGGKVTGQVVDRAGATAPDVTVIVFAEDRAQWSLSSRFIKAVRPDRTGRFSVSGLPPAAYRVVARDFVLEGQWEDPEFLESLLKEAARLELAEGASEAIKLTLEAR